MHKLYKEKRKNRLNMPADTIIYCVPVMGYLYLLWMLRAIRSMILIATIFISTTLMMQVNASVNFSTARAHDEGTLIEEIDTLNAILYLDSSSSSTTCMID